MGNGMKVYHLPLLPFIKGDVALIVKYNLISVIRQILIREHVDICHGHLGTSITSAMVIYTAKLLGLKTVKTEHSHFTYNEVGMIMFNKLCMWYLKETDATIAVSHASKENFTLRAKVDPQTCFVIPNAVDTNKFIPNPSLRFPLNTINIVYVSRMDQKKGTSMLLDIIPVILAKHPNAYFILGGDGPQLQLLDQFVQKYSLQNNVELLGSIPHDKVRYVMNRGHIFLNTSLSETFCMSNLEAASCGLLLVSTDVGGIPEVLPPGVAYLAKPDPKSLISQLFRAIKDYEKIQSQDFHQFVKNTYSWHNVAERTENVYNFVMNKPVLNTFNRIKSQLCWGPIVGMYGVLNMILEFILMLLLDWRMPENEIDICRNFNMQQYSQNPHRFGDHELSIPSLASNYKEKESNIPKHSGYNMDIKKKSKRKNKQSLINTNRYCTFPSDVEDHELQSSPQFFPTQ